MSDKNMFLTLDRYDQLLRSEQDANYLKALLAEKFENYGTFSREELKMLYTMFIGKKEEE